MGRRSFSLIGFALLTGLAGSASVGAETERRSFGETLYYAYQGKWFEALEQLNSGVYGDGEIEQEERDAFWYASVDANFSVGDFELNYRMHRRAARVIQTALRESSKGPFHNNAAYRLARLHFRKGQVHDALRALDRITGDVPGDIREDVAFLRASIYLALEWPDPAIPVLEKLLKSSEYGAFAAYNLGIAYLQGDLQESAYDQLDRAGRIKARNDADAAIRDKANLVLGTLLHEKGQYNRAIVYLNRVRLDGPFSNRALLSSGWANMSAGRPKKAIVSWAVLAERDATDRATQEAMLALPYAYSQLDLHNQAAAYYSRALNAYAEQLDKLGRSIRSIEDGRFLDALLRDEIREDEDWVIRLRALPDTPETYYLMELLASNDFQTGLENFLDLADLKQRLSGWPNDLAAYDELIAARKRHFEALLPGIDGQLEELDARLQQQRARQTALLERRSEMAMSGEPQAEYGARLIELDRNLQALDDAVARAQRQYDRFLAAQQVAVDSYTGYDEPVERLSGKTKDAVARIDNLLMRQGQLIEKLASEELRARLRRLDVYAGKARFGLADSKDRMLRKGEQ